MLVDYLLTDNTRLRKVIAFDGHLHKKGMGDVPIPLLIIMPLIQPYMLRLALLYHAHKTKHPLYFLYKYV